jgi:hypothetical protein
MAVICASVNPRSPNPRWLRFPRHPRKQLTRRACGWMRSFLGWQSFARRSPPNRWPAVASRDCWIFCRGATGLAKGSARKTSHRGYSASRAIRQPSKPTAAESKKPMKHITFDNENNITLQKCRPRDRCWRLLGRRTVCGLQQRGQHQDAGERRSHRARLARKEGGLLV